MTPKDYIQTLEEIEEATSLHRQALIDADIPSLQDVIDGMEITLSKINTLLEEVQA
jgi:hypothetical protein